jgi:hypothetical protein
MLSNGIKTSSAKFQQFTVPRFMLLLKELWENDKLYDMNTYINM